MIICPKCKEEIEERSYYCDQCGQALLYCNRCGRVGIGRRCTNCGGMMVSPIEMEKNSVSSSSSQVSLGMSNSMVDVSASLVPHHSAPSALRSNRTLRLLNSSLDITIEGMDGAVIGRKQGPYVQNFQNNMYVSGVHAQLHYKAGTGWYIVDKHSSNGTKLNNRSLQPDVEMLLSDGDVLMIANVNLKVSIS